MRLVIDVGNTSVKVAVYSKSKLLKKTVVDHGVLIDEVKALLIRYTSLKEAIISSVGKISSSDFKELNKLINLLVLDHNTKIPFTNNYKTPKTLGVDRIALVAAAAKYYASKDVLVIDAGTCITYDFLDHNNCYQGGAISPGITTRYRSLNNLTVNLPLLEKRMPKNMIGKSTNQSIHSGVIYGVINEIEGVITQYNRTYQDLTVILTGGDTKFLAKRLKNSIFANSNFLLDGLNYILELNSD